MASLNKIKNFVLKKKRGEKITMLTAYDFPLASIIDSAGIDVILVGDSLANVVLGLESTTQVGMTEMLHHTKAVRRAVKQAMVVGDMPFSAYQTQPQAAVKNATAFMTEGGCDAIKLEWFKDCIPVSKRIVKAGIPLMGHVGLTPQTADQLGGFKVQGKDALAARKIIDQAKALEEVGCFAIVLECIPDKLAGYITQLLKIPTIGIGAGNQCDGQVLVSHDMLGLFSRFHPKFAKSFADAGQVIKAGVQQYIREVKNGTFPDSAHSYGMSEEEWQRLKRG